MTRPHTRFGRVAAVTGAAALVVGLGSGAAMAATTPRTTAPAASSAEATDHEAATVDHDTLQQGPQSGPNTQQGPDTPGNG